MVHDHIQPMTRVRVLVVDDELAIRKLLERGLSAFGYRVVTVNSTRLALLHARQESPDVILLDVHLESELDGIEVCRQLREWSKTPIIMLSVADDKVTKLAALNGGADDYITKPFDMDELEARIRTVLRRSAIEDAQSISGEIRANNLVIDLVNRRVKLHGNDVHLTPKEYELLKILATNRGKVLTFSMLFSQISGHKDSARPEHIIRVYINSLRKKLTDDPDASLKPRFIVTEPGIGYRFVDA